MKTMMNTIKLALLALGMAAFAATARAEYTDDCITFSSAEAFSLKTYNGKAGWDGTLWTSTDKTNWAEWDGTTVSAAQTGGTGLYNLHVRGNEGNMKITGDYQYRWVLTGTVGVSCTGNIETLRGATENDPSPTDMADYCYDSMFHGCTSLTTAPTLPATTLASLCYASMFEGCTALKEAPALPATTLAPMWYPCYGCYYGMFNGCTSLTTAPALPATRLMDNCYSYMFKGCTALTAAPALPATELAYECYDSMFSGCTALTTVPELPATELMDDCYNGMFSGCTALEVNTAAPGRKWKIPATSTTASNWGFYMFYGTKGTLQDQPELNTTYYIASAPPSNDDCITFSSAAAFTLKTKKGAKNWDGTLWTSTDKTNWTEWNGGEVSAAQTNSTYNLYVRGDTNNTKITGYVSVISPQGGAWVLTGSNIACTGNIETLRGAMDDDPSPTEMATFCYYCMFSGCTALTAAPTLPATTLAEFCYSGMFVGCTALKDVPALPATTLANYCYNGMFSGCTALEVNTAAPGREWKIPATGTTATDWGTDMFRGSAGTLQGQPELNVTYYIASAPPPNDDCITFSGTEGFSLRTVNGKKSWDGTLWTSTDKIYWTEWNGAKVSAAQTGGTYNLHVRGDANNTKITGDTTVDYRWFLDGGAVACTGNIETLRGATGDDPSPTEMAESCYYGMFYGCTALTVAPALPATTLASGCYSDMFHGCTALTEAPDLPATTLSQSCYLGIFANCTSLTAAPALPATTLANYCYSGMFYGCTSLKEAPALPATTLAERCYQGMFQGCMALTNAPAVLPAMTLADNCYSAMFEGCTALTSAPALPATTLAEDCYSGMFEGCTALTTAPALPATRLMDSCYSCMFEGCTALTDAPDLPASTLEEHCYWSMFKDCSALTTAPALPATTLAEGCYCYMFQGCTALTEAPEVLPAMTLATQCYYYMFHDCTSLKGAPELPATTLAQSCYESMFGGCTALTDAPDLPATTLAQSCYSYMFYDCTALEVNAVAPGREWRIPATSTTASNWGSGMFKNTKGTLQGQPELNRTYYIKGAFPPGSEANPWKIGAGKGNTVAAWTNGTTLVIQGAGMMKDFDTEDSLVPWPVEQIAAVEIAGSVTSIGQNAWLGLADGVSYNNLSATAAKTMGNGFGGTTQYARTAFREFLVNGASINATVALETAKSLTNEWVEVELTDEDVHVENGRIVIQHESAPQSQGFYLLQPTE